MHLPNHLQELYLKSLTPFEVLEFCKKNDCTFNAADPTCHVDYWKENICKNASDISFEKYCSMYGLSNLDIQRMTSPISSVKEKFKTPVWLSTLAEVITNIEVDNSIFNGPKIYKEQPFQHLLMPFIQFFISQFQKKLNQDSIPYPTSAISTQLRTVLLKALSDMGQQALLEAFEQFKQQHPNKNRTAKPTDSGNTLYRAFIQEQLEDKFCQLFLKYPMLARRLSTRTYQFTEFMAGLFKKYHKDRAEIAYRFELELDELSNLHLEAGDQHHGESTVILEFKSKAKVVYKPGSVATTIAYNCFLEWVNEQLGETLKSFRVIEKKDYGWLEFVDQKDAEGTHGIQRYYKRAGMLVGIAYFLNARDYHYENVIASGDCPVLIDHETIVGPNVKNKDEEDSAMKRIVGTILESLLLPVDIEDIPSYVCGFGSSTMQSINAFTTTVYNCNSDNMKRCVRIELVNLFKSNKPYKNGAIKNLVDFQEDFKQGFYRIYHLVLENKEFLLSKDSPINLLKGLQIRFICRFTKIYYEIQKVLNQPDYMKDAIKYGLKLELLGRAYLEKPGWRALLDSERAQMLSGDIPAFYTNTSSNQLELPKGEVLDIFESNTIDSISRKIKNANFNDYNEQLNLINQVIHL